MTNNESLREQVARAICLKSGHNPDQKIDIDHTLFWTEFLPEADTALRIIIEHCAGVADARANHVEELYRDEKGVTDVRVAFQVSAQLIAQSIRSLIPSEENGVTQK